MQGRVRLLRKYVDKALVIFPFEEKFYRDRGVDAEFVGHPLADLPRPSISREDYAAQNGLNARKPWITLMPGSRVKEVRMNLPEILRAAEAKQTMRELLRASGRRVSPNSLREHFYLLELLGAINVMPT